MDVRDLAGWLVIAAEQHLTGTYDATSPPMPRGEVLAQVAAGVGTEPTFAARRSMRWPPVVIGTFVAAALLLYEVA